MQDSYDIIKQQIADAQQLQWVASQTRNAAAVGRLDSILEDLYRKQDQMRAGVR